MSRKMQPQAFLVPLSALFAAGQLVAEAARGIFPYDYPVQDLRLVAVLLFAAANGICLMMHVLLRFRPPGLPWLAVAILAATAVAILLVEGFDGMTLMAVIVPVAFSALVSFWAAKAGNEGARPYGIALVIFSLALYHMPYAFLDVYFYYLVAAFLLFLFAQQVRKIIEDQRLRQVEKARADRLQLALEGIQERQSPSSISVKQQGKVDVLPTDRLVFCKGARDYVELVQPGANPILYAGTLAELEKQLPGTFLRVHRSYLVNTAFIQSLTREASGSGELALSTGHAVPVSRRIMPSVRKALA